MKIRSKKVESFCIKLVIISTVILFALMAFGCDTNVQKKELSSLDSSYRRIDSVLKARTVCFERICLDSIPFEEVKVDEVE